MKHFKSNILPAFAINTEDNYEDSRKEGALKLAVYLIILEKLYKKQQFTKLCMSIVKIYLSVIFFIAVILILYLTTL